MFLACLLPNKCALRIYWGGVFREGCGGSRFFAAGLLLNMRVAHYLDVAVFCRLDGGKVRRGICRDVWFGGRFVWPDYLPGVAGDGADAAGVRLAG